VARINYRLISESLSPVSSLEPGKMDSAQASSFGQQRGAQVFSAFFSAKAGDEGVAAQGDREGSDSDSTMSH